MDLKQEELAELRPLRAVPESDIQTLLSLGATRALERGEVVYAVDEPVPHAVLLVRGRLSAQVVEDGAPRSVGDVWPGEIAGESALFGPGHRSQVQVVAMAPSVVLELTPELMRAAAGSQAMASLQVHLVQVLSRRIRSTNLALRRAWQEQRRPASSRPAVSGPPPAEPSLLDRLRTLLGGGGWH